MAQESDFTKDYTTSNYTIETSLKRFFDFAVQRALIEWIAGLICVYFLDLSPKTMWVFYILMAVYMPLRDLLPKGGLFRIIWREAIVDKDGNTATLKQRFLRNIILAIPMGDVVELIAGLCITIKSDSSRRLGDLLAGTYVISCGKTGEFKRMAESRKMRENMTEEELKALL